MGGFVDFLHRYLAPFVTGVCMAGVTVVHDVSAIVVLTLAAGICGYISLPAGGRMIKRITGVAS